MSDLGLLMNAEMALAWHEGRKTVTRRPISPQPSLPLCMEVDDAGEGPWIARIPGAGIARFGQRVWCRETFQIPIREIPPSDNAPTRRRGDGFHDVVVYRAGASGADADWYRWRPSIHMPKWASRSWGEIVSVRPCNLSDIDDTEAALEGFASAADLLDVLSALYPDAKWFWRTHWKPIDRPDFA